jgi:restriction system protein
MPKQNESKGGPEFVRYFWPVIDALRELGGSGRPAEVRKIIAEKLRISDEAQTELMAGGAPRYDNKVAWARFYLSKADFIDASTRGVWSLTEKGRSVKRMSFEEAVVIFKQVHENFSTVADSENGDALNPTNETIAPPTATSSEGEDYRKQLMNLLSSLPSSGFERLCQYLLRESGFEQVSVTGRTGDGGIDGHGVLQINPLVSFKVLFQCKRYTGSVSSSQVRDFRGAMAGRADKGIIITTGTFTAEAQKEALRDGVPPIELVNGEKLLTMFEQLELGLIPRKPSTWTNTFFQEFLD